jgi:26S proteasome regulatory subunit N1
MVNLWNSDQGANEINEYLELSDVYSKQGACIGIGLFSTGLTDDSDPAIALLSDFVDSK